MLTADRLFRRQGQTPDLVLELQGLSALRRIGRAVDVGPMRSMAGRTRDEVLRGLVADGVLSHDQAEAVNHALEAEEPKPTGAPWAEIAGYVGGGLLLAGAVTLVALSWEELARLARILILVVSTVALLAAGLGVAGGPRGVRSPRSPVRTRLSAALLALASGTTASAAAVVVTDHESVAAGLAGLIVAVAGYALVPTALGVLASAVFSALATGSLADDLSGGSVLVIGLAVSLVGALWIALAEAGVLPHRVLGLAVGAVLALFGGQQLLGSDETVPWAYALTFGVALACLALYWRERTWVLLVAGVLGVTIAVPEALWDWTNGTVGAALIMIVTGAALIATALLAMWLRRANILSP